MSDGQTKQFGKGQRTVPAQKAQKWYPVDDESQPKKVSIPRESTWTYIEKEIRTCVDYCGWMRHDLRVCGLNEATGKDWQSHIVQCSVQFNTAKSIDDR